MKWTIKFHQAFRQEFYEFSEDVRDELLATASLLEERGPMLGRPYADTLKGSSYSNMKELRFRADNGVWRVAFAYDPQRQAILLVAGSKSGKSEKRFYENLISKADERFTNYLSNYKENSHDINITRRTEKIT